MFHTYLLRDQRTVPWEDQNKRERREEIKDPVMTGIPAVGDSVGVMLFVVLVFFCLLSSSSPVRKRRST